MTEKQIIIPCGDGVEVITEREVREVQKRINKGWILCRHDITLLDRILSYFCMNVMKTKDWEQMTESEMASALTKIECPEWQ